MANNNEPPKVTADVYIEVWVGCPHCQEYKDIFDEDEITEAFAKERLNEELEIQITCGHCSKDYIVQNLRY